MPGLTARADACEQQDVVGVRREDRIGVEVLRRREAVEVLRAVRRPPRTDHHRDDRKLLQPDLRELRRDRVLLLDVERRPPLVEEGRRLRVGEVLPVPGRGAVLARRDVGVLVQVRVEVAVQRAARGDLPEQGRVLRRHGVRGPATPVGLEPHVRVDADRLEVLRDDLVRGDPVRPARDHVDVELHGVALRVDQVVALVGEAGVRERLLRGRRVVFRHGLRLGLHRLVDNPAPVEPGSGHRPAQAEGVRRRLVAVLAELPDRVAVDREAHGLAEGNEAVWVLRVVEHERDRVVVVRVEGVVVRLVDRLVRLLDVLHEVVRPVDLSALDLRDAGVVRRGPHVLEARDLRQALLPVVRVLAQDVVLSREARDLVVRTGADGIRVRERRGILDARPDVLRHDEDAVERRRDELRVGRLELDHDRMCTLGADRRDVVVGAGEADAVHRLVLPAGCQAVGDVGGRQRLAVRPLGVRRNVQGEGLVAVRPLPAARQPGDRPGPTGRNHDQRLVHRALHERVARERAAGVRVEVLGERRIARPGHHEALVSRGVEGVGPPRRGRGCRAHREHGERHDPCRGDCERTDAEGAHCCSFLTQRAG